jgi:hypothetical protein
MSPIGSASALGSTSAGSGEETKPEGSGLHGILSLPADVYRDIREGDRFLGIRYVGRGEVGPVFNLDMPELVYDPDQLTEKDFARMPRGEEDRRALGAEWVRTAPDWDVEEVKQAFGQHPDPPSTLTGMDVPLSIGPQFYEFNPYADLQFYIDLYLTDGDEWSLVAQKVTRRHQTHLGLASA